MIPTSWLTGSATKQEPETRNLEIDRIELTSADSYLVQDLMKFGTGPVSFFIWIYSYKKGS
jgi:hypothetical protein